MYIFYIRCVSLLGFLFSDPPSLPAAVVIGIVVIVTGPSKSMWPRSSKDLCAAVAAQHASRVALKTATATKMT